MTSNNRLHKYRGLALFGRHCAALLLLACGACGAPRLANTPAAPTDLSGHWVLEPALSDDAVSLIKAALPAPRKRTARAERAMDAGEPISMPDQQSGSGAGGRGQRQGQRSGAAAPVTQQAEPPPWLRVGPSDFVRAFALPPARLEVSATQAVVVIAGGDRRRSLVPGDPDPVSINDRFGSRNVWSGWNGAAFVIDSRDGSRLRVTERYQRVTNDRLEAFVEFNASGIKALKIKSQYRRATAQELADLPADGPPPPGAR